MQEGCIFCKIVNKEIPTDFDEVTQDLIVFKDIHPKAQIHLLIVPKKHLTDMRDDDGRIWKSVGEIVKKLAEKYKVKGFRIVHNGGEAAIVKHMHFHFLAEVGVDREV